MKKTEMAPAQQLQDAEVGLRAVEKFGELHKTHNIFSLYFTLSIKFDSLWQKFSQNAHVFTLKKKENLKQESIGVFNQC